jgi:hypothetical protein
METMALAPSRARQGNVLFRGVVDRRLTFLGDTMSPVNYTVARLMGHPIGNYVVLRFSVDDVACSTPSREITVHLEELRAGLRELESQIPTELLDSLREVGPSAFVAAMREVGAPRPISGLVQLQDMQGFPVTYADWAEHLVLFRRLIALMDPIWETTIDRPSFTTLGRRSTNRTWISVLNQGDGTRVVRIRYHTNDLTSGRHAGDFTIDADTLRRGIVELNAAQGSLYFVQELYGMPITAHDQVPHFLELMTALVVADPVHTVSNGGVTITGTRYQNLPWLLVERPSGDPRHFFVADTVFEQAREQLQVIIDGGHPEEPVTLAGFRGVQFTPTIWQQMLNELAERLA